MRPAGPGVLDRESAAIDRRNGIGEARVAPRQATRIAAVVLAAGESRRMEGANKLLMEVDGRAVVSWVVEAVRGAGVSGIYVVLGHEADEVRREIGGVGVTFVENEAY